MFKQIVLRLTLAKMTTVLAVAAGVAGALASHAQSPQPADRSASPEPPRFEVVSIRPCKVEDAGGGGKKGGGGTIRWDPGRLSEECQTVFNLIRNAYLAYPDGKPWPVAALGDAGSNEPGQLACTGCGGGLPPISNRQFGQPIKGSPAWLRSDRYTIDAKAARPESIAMMRGPMMQAVLEDRFKLKIHRENREVPVYELTLAKGRSKLRRANEGSCIPAGRWEPTAIPSRERPMPSGAPIACGEPSWSTSGLDFNGTTIAHLCELLSGWVDRDVIDKTGLAGMFDFHFDLPPRVAPEDGVPAESAMFTAMMPALEGSLGSRSRLPRNSANSSSSTTWRGHPATSGWHTHTRRESEVRAAIPPAQSPPRQPEDFRAQKLISSGVVEGLNNKAKTTMRKSYGFRT